jgi:hypothetical protein
MIPILFTDIVGYAQSMRHKEEWGPTLPENPKIHLSLFKKYLIIIIWISCVFQSCDPSNFTLPAYQADLYLPVLDIELNVGDLILADSAEILQEDTSGLVSIQYNSYTAKYFEELFPIDDQSQVFTIPGIPGAVPDFQIELKTPLHLFGLQPGFYPELEPIEINFNFEVEIEKFIEADFSSGTLKIELINKFPFVINEGLTIERINKGEENPIFSLVTDRTIDPGQNYIFDEVNLSGETLTGTFTLQIHNFSTPGGKNINLEPDSTLIFNISYNDIVLEKARLAQPEIELPSVKFDLHINSQYDARIKLLEIETGQIILQVPGLNDHYFIKTTFPTATQNGVPLTFDFSLNNTEIYLDNLKVDLSTKSPYYNVLPIEMELVFKDDIESFDIVFDRPLIGKIEMSNIDYKYLTGYLGQSTDVLEEHVELSIFSTVQGGTLKFDDPQIKVEISNGAGATGVLKNDGNGLYIKGKNEKLFGDQEVSIGASLEGFVIEPALGPGEPQMSVIEMNKTSEPDLVSFFSLSPTQVSARIPVLAGTSEVLFDQFLDGDALIELNLQIDLPLNIAADRFILTDTSDYKIQNDPDKFEIQTAFFQGRYESQFPLQLSFQVLFLDDQYQLIDSLFDEYKIIDPAEIGPDGEVLEPVIGELQVNVSRDQIENYRNISYAVPIVGLHTPDGQFVKLLSSYKFYFKLIGELVTDIDLNP